MQASLSEEETSPKIVEALIKLKVCVHVCVWGGEAEVGAASVKDDVSGDIRETSACCMGW